jgi:hypothetical protein
LLDFCQCASAWAFMAHMNESHLLPVCQRSEINSTYMNMSPWLRFGDW